MALNRGRRLRQDLKPRNAQGLEPTKRAGSARNAAVATAAIDDGFLRRTRHETGDFVGWVVGKRLVCRIAPSKLLGCGCEERDVRRATVDEGQPNDDEVE